jgi:nucleotide-binding universal stress UspA family protein
VSTILIGVDGSDRSEDAIALGRRLAQGAGTVVVACAFPDSFVPRRAANAGYRDALGKDARGTAQRMRALLTGLPEERTQVRIVPNGSPAHALHDLAVAEDAALIVLGSTHTGRAGRVLSGSTGERLLHGAPCSVAIAPKDYRTYPEAPIRKIGVAYDGSPEAQAARSAAADLTRALGAGLELIGVADPAAYGTPALLGGPSVVTLLADVELHVREGLEPAAASLHASSVVLTGSPAHELAAYSASLDVLVIGSRGYGPLRSVLVGGVSGRLVRSAQCPVIVVPRGVAAPFGELFGSAAATAT